MVTVESQFTTKTKNSKNAIYFLPTVSYLINKLKSHMLFTGKTLCFPIVRTKKVSSKIRWWETPATFLVTPVSATLKNKAITYYRCFLNKWQQREPTLNIFLYKRNLFKRFKTLFSLLVIIEWLWKKSGFNENIKYARSQLKQRNRKRQIIWFNPPYSVNVKTNVGKLFMRLIDKHFPSHHKFHKLFNRNNVKLSYSCMPSMKNVIQKHNSKIMEDPKTNQQQNLHLSTKIRLPFKSRLSLWMFSI